MPWICPEYALNMPWICPLEYPKWEGYWVRPFLMVLSQCTRSESWATCSSAIGAVFGATWYGTHVLLFVSTYIFVMFTDLLGGVEMTCRYQLGSLSCGDSAVIIGVTVSLVMFMAVLAVIASAGLLLHVIRRFLTGRALRAGAGGSNVAREFDTSQFWMMDDYPACLPPSYSQAMQDYSFDGILADNAGEMSTMVWSHGFHHERTTYDNVVLCDHVTMWKGSAAVKLESSWLILFWNVICLCLSDQKIGKIFLSICKQLRRYRVSNLTKVWCCLRILQYFISIKPDCYLWIWIKVVPKRTLM